MTIDGSIKDEEEKRKGGTVMTDMEIEIYEAEHQPLWLLDLENEAESDDEDEKN